MNLLRTMLFLPGNNPGMLQNGGVFGADAVILDLEDAVSPTEKDSARFLVANALRNVNYYSSKTVVRTNPFGFGGEADIASIVPAKPYGLLLPKIETAEELNKIIAYIEQFEEADGHKVAIIPLIETALGVANINSIALSHKRIEAIAFGAEDYTASIGTSRTTEGLEIFNARTVIVNAAAAAGVDAIDTPFTDVQDEEALLKDSHLAKGLGFKGKLAINPRQIDTIHEAFSPTEKEIKWAVRVLDVIEEAKRQGSGVISLDGKMIDAPIVLRAERTLKIAEYLNLPIGDEA